MKKIRIESDGTLYGVKITDAETGALIPGVVSVTWKATAGQLPVATLEMQCAVMDVVAEMEEAKDDPPH